MQPMQLAILFASQGNNKLLAQKINKVAADIGFKTTLLDLVALELPLFSQALLDQSGIPKTLYPVGKNLQSAQGLAVVSPEYNGGPPPSLVNAIAWVSRLDFEGGWRACFQNKPTMLASASGGPGTRMLCGLRIQLSYLGAHVIGREVSLALTPKPDPDIHKCLEELWLLARSRSNR